MIFKQTRRILALTAIPLLVLSFASTAVMAQTTASHDVFESQDSIQISNSSPIPYYPGVLIGIPSGGTVVDASTVTTISAGSAQIAIGEGAITDSSGTYKVIVITDASSGPRYVIGIGTIIKLASDGTYQSAETDVYVQNGTSVRGLFSTQEHVYFTTPETLTQHYGLLATALVALSNLYVSTGAPRVGAIYSRLVGQLQALSSIISSDYPMYDKMISTLAGVITLHVLPDGIYKCSSVYLSQQQQGGPDNILGTFTSYVNKGYYDYNFIDFSGAINFGGVSENYQAIIEALPIAITSASITPAWGGAFTDYVTQQISSTHVLWSTFGLPGGWSVTVGTNSASAPSPASVGVEVNSIGYPVTSSLALC